MVVSPEPSKMQIKSSTASAKSITRLLRAGYHPRRWTRLQKHQKVHSLMFAHSTAHRTAKDSRVWIVLVEIAECWVTQREARSTIARAAVKSRKRRNVARQTC